MPSVKKFGSILAFSLCVLLAASCSRDGEFDPVKGYSHVFIYCGLGYNNLSGYLEDDLEEMEEGLLPELNRDLAVVAFCHNTANPMDFSTPSSPVLVRLYRDKGAVCADTLKVYPEEMVSASASSVREMMLDVQQMFPSESYGMLFSSHAGGWLPVGYSSAGENRGVMLMSREPDPSLPLTKTLGAQYESQGSHTISTEIDIREFADALPMHLDYLIFDACLLGCVEVAWELRDVCDMIAFSPTEVLAGGFVYETLVKNLMAASKPDLEAVCRDYFEMRDSMDGLYRSAAVTLVDCSALGELAGIFRNIVSYGRNSLAGIDRNSVQKYFYDDGSYFFFYDLRDLAAAMGAEPSMLEELDAALERCVVYHAETPTFFGLELERCCGLSVYFPSAAWPVLNGYYRTLGWNEAVGLVQ